MQSHTGHAQTVGAASDSTRPGSLPGARNESASVFGGRTDSRRICCDHVDVVVTCREPRALIRVRTSTGASGPRTALLLPPAAWLPRHPHPDKPRLEHQQHQHQHARPRTSKIARPASSGILQPDSRIPPALPPPPMLPRAPSPPPSPLAKCCSSTPRAPPKSAMCGATP